MIQEQTKPPRNIIKGVKLLVGALGLGILRGGTGIPMLEEPTAILITVIVVVPFILLGVFLIYMIYKEKHWAKITQLVLFFVGIILNIENMILWSFAAPILLVLYTAEIIVTIIALFFIFQEKSLNQSE